MAEKSQEDIIKDLISENKVLHDTNNEMLKRLDSLTNRIEGLTNQQPAQDEPAKLPQIPDREYKVKVDGQTVKVRFTVAKFRLNNDSEMTAKEASTDDEIMQQLVRDRSGVIRILE